MESKIVPITRAPVSSKAAQLRLRSFQVHFALKSKRPIILPQIMLGSTFHQREVTTMVYFVRIYFCREAVENVLMYCSHGQAFYVWFISLVFQLCG